MDLEETLVAHAFATSSIKLISIETGPENSRQLLTCTIVVCIEHGKESANDKDVGVVVELHHLEGLASSVDFDGLGVGLG
jgi:hypothetical protein